MVVAVDYVADVVHIASNARDLNVVLGILQLLEDLSSHRRHMRYMRKAVLSESHSHERTIRFFNVDADRLIVFTSSNLIFKLSSPFFSLCSYLSTELFGSLPVFDEVYVKFRQRAKNSARNWALQLVEKAFFLYDKTFFEFLNNFY